MYKKKLMNRANEQRKNMLSAMAPTCCQQVPGTVARTSREPMVLVYKFVTFLDIAQILEILNLWNLISTLRQSQNIHI